MAKASDIVVFESLAIGATVTLGRLGSGKGLPSPPVYAAVFVLAGGLIALSRVNGRTAVALGGIALAGAALSSVDGGTALAAGAAKQLGKLGKNFTPPSKGETATEKYNALSSVATSAVDSAASVSGGVVSGTLSPSGGWGGTEGPVKAVTANLPAGFSVVSEKRDRMSTSSGGVSDHWVGSKTSFARDIGWGSGSPTAASDALASRIVAALGGPSDWGRSGGNFVTTVNGIRWQVIYRSMVGGNHYNHIHVGARRA